MGRQLKTAGQWLAEFKVHDKGRKSQVCVLNPPVRVGYVTSDNLSQQSLVCHSSTGLFALFQRLHLCRGVIVRLGWKGAKLGAKGLYDLNHAIHSFAVKKRGLNIVRHWLETERGCLTATRSDFPALLSYLEVRPILKKNCLPVSETLSIMSNKRLDIRRSRKTGRKRLQKPSSCDRRR